MSVRRVASRWRSFTPMLLLGLLGCEACLEEPWPEPTASVAHSLAVVPHELHVHVTDPGKPVSANLIAFVHDEYGRNIDDHRSVFAVTSGGARFRLDPLGSHSDSVSLVVVPECSAAGDGCATMPITAIVEARHPASGLAVPITVHVTYGAPAGHGVSSGGRVSAWPMFGVATGVEGGVWKSRMMRPFVNRTRFGLFTPAEVVDGADDEESAAVLSYEHAGVRQVRPWRVPPNDVALPELSLPRSLDLKPFYAGDPAQLDAVREEFLIALAAGADVISQTPIGVRVELSGPVVRASEIAWTMDCPALGVALAALPTEQRPDPDALNVYMLGFPAGQPVAERAGYCPAAKLAMPGALVGAHVIVVPQGTALASTVAHEIGHALGLTHVTFGSGFNDDNLMAVTDDLSAPMRHRLTVGQAFRAAFDPRSILVQRQPNAAGTVDCLDTPKKCPSVATDALRRAP